MIETKTHSPWNLHRLSEFWACFTAESSELAELANRIYHAVANSAPSERAFSAMKLVQNHRRTRLTHDNVDMLLFCYSNGPKIDRIPSVPQVFKPGEAVKPVSWYNVEEDDLNVLDEAIFDDYVASKILHVELEEMNALDATETDDVNTKNNTQTAIAIAFEDSQETQDASFYSQNSL